MMPASQMLIHELAERTGVAAKTIRYYESVALMPRPQRAANAYRQYATADVERLRFIASARSLGFRIEDIREILGARDKGKAPCQGVLDTIDERISNVDRRIAGLVALGEVLGQLRREGEVLPLDDLRGDHCVCYLLKSYRESGQIVIEREEVHALLGS